MKKSLLLFLSACCLLTTFAQDDHKHCGADEMRIQTLKANPKIVQAVIARDQALERHTQHFVRDFYNAGLNGSTGHSRSATYTIPVVFHVIHNFGTENISDAQILDGLDILNKTFRKQLADTASIVAAFKPIHADCDIEFALAKLDPDGNCTSGINRIASTLTTIGDHSVKTLIQWPTHQYLNIYIVDQAAGLAGHCVWPSDADTIPEWDGIVIGHDYVGSIGTSTYTRSVALAHECGHYLNLHHIWGGNNVPGFYYLPCGDPGNCGETDFVADTPTTLGWQSCSLTGATCGNPVDNVQNTMDYSYCNRMFTIGQKARMQACLNSTIAGRFNLWQPANLLATGVSTPTVLCAADFSASKTVICNTAPNTINFSNTSYHGYTGMEWTFPGGSPATSTAVSPTVTYNVAGAYDVSLKVYNATDTIEVTKEKYIQVMPSTALSAYPYSEGFETTTSLHGNDWFLNNMGSESNWALTNVPFSGSMSVVLNNFDNTVPGKDELIGPMIDLSAGGSVRISFRYSFAKKDPVNNDKLQLMSTVNCNTWTQRLMLTGTALETAPPTATSFVPASASEWKLASIGIPLSLLTNDFRFKFVHTSYGGNNLYIDDINIDIGAGLEELPLLHNNWQLYPNPAGSEVQLAFALEENTELAISVLDMMGKTVYSLAKQSYTMGENMVRLPLNALAPGMYRVNMTNGVAVTGRPLVVVK